ncbi:MAG TPA: alpha-L-arabinofuranosidase C-terminal domain-containing protein [Rhizomicrobium sp.]|jgi:alpha-N-arabinofuranosidase
MKVFCGALIACAMLAGSAARAADAPAGTIDATITIHADRPGATIAPEIYGQFAEHLGHLMYGGLWVGPKSPIPNVRGFRKDVVEALKRLGVPVVRWPGGCFADQYHWRDGIGPRDRRPVRINTTWGGVEETNAVGTHEYMDLVGQLGAKAYIDTNVGTGSPQETKDWLEYLTSPSHSELAQLRRKNGRDAPWRIDYVGFGNEPWGCGGDMRPEYYADLYHRFAAFAKTPDDAKPLKLAAGPYDDKTELTEALMKTNSFGDMDAITIHHYALPTGDWSHKGAAIGFPESQWMSTMQAALKMEDFIRAQTAVMDKYDPDKKVGLDVDEWGNWYDPSPGSNPGFLEQQDSLRDAITAALNFNIFQAHADRVRMTCIAQVVNVLQALVLTDGPKMVLTPTYWAFMLYKPFRGATDLPVDVTSPNYALDGATLSAIHASAARTAAGGLVIALVNIDPHRAAHIAATIAGASVAKVSGTIITADTMDAHNTFSRPDVVKPQPFSAASVSGGTLQVNLPAKSVVVLQLQRCFDSSPRALVALPQSAVAGRRAEGRLPE